MGSFADGFTQGRGIVNDALDRQQREKEFALRQAEAARNATRFENEQADYQRRKGIETQTDALRDGLIAPNRGNYAITPEGAGQGLKMPDAGYTGEGLQGPTTGYLAPEAPAAPGLKAQAPKNGYTFKGAPTQAESEDVLGRIALLNGDAQGYRASQATVKKLRDDAEDSAYAMAVHKDPKGPEAQEARSWINNTSQKVSTKLDPKTGMTIFAIVKGDGYDERSMSPEGTAKIAVGVKRLLRGDLSGLDLIASVNKDIASTVAAEMNLTLNVGKANNEAVDKGLTRLELERHHKADEGIKRGAANKQAAAIQKYDDRMDAADEAAGLLQGYRVAQNSGAKDAAGIYGPLYEAAAIRAQGVGVKLPGLKGGPVVDPEKYASVLKDLVGAGYSPTDAAMQADKMFGVAPEAGNLVGRLAELSAAKDKAKGSAPKDTKPKTNWAQRPPLFDPVQQSAEKDLAFAQRTSLGLTR